MLEERKKIQTCTGVGMAVGTINLGKFWAISGKYLGIRSMYFLVTYLT